MNDLPSEEDSDARIELIVDYYLKSPFVEMNDDLIVYNCAVNNLFSFLQLLLSHRSDDSAVIKGVNICDSEKTDE